MKLNFCQLNREKNGLNAVSIFAQLGDEEQVLSLVKSGGKLEDAVYGYALGGHTKKVNTILETRPELMIYAAKGYARVDNTDETDPLAASTELSIKRALLEGHAQAAKTTKINAGLRSRNHKDYMSSIIAGLAQCDHFEELIQYAINEEWQNMAITAAATSGNAPLVNKLLKRQDIVLEELHQPISASTKLALGHALIGYSKGRRYEHIEKLLQFGINPMLCLTAISEKDIIHESDMTSLSLHISSKPLLDSLLALIKDHFTIKAEGDMKDFSNDSELKRVLEGDLVKSQPLAANL